MRWLTGLHRRLQLYPETLALAVSMVDRFLASVKVQHHGGERVPVCLAQCVPSQAGGGALAPQRRRGSGAVRTSQFDPKTLLSQLGEWGEALKGCVCVGQGWILVLPGSWILIRVSRLLLNGL